jgi:hypothetical protein
MACFELIIFAKPYTIRNMEMAASLQREELQIVKMPIDVEDRISIPSNKKPLSTYRYVLYCNSCQWSISYCECSDLLGLSEDYVNCPNCKAGGLGSSMHLI